MASRSWNRVELMGNLTRDPELRFTPNGAAVCTFGVATNRSYMTDGERKEEVDFHNIVAWNKLAELCNQLLKKGARVFVSGRLQNRDWEGQDGQKRNRTEIVIEDMIVINNPKASDETPAASLSTSEVSQIMSEKPVEVGTKEAEVKVEEKTADDAEEKVEVASAEPEEEKKEEQKPEEAAKVNEDIAPDDLPF